VHSNIVELLRQGVCVTINPDDPTYFDGCMMDNFTVVVDIHPIEKAEIA